MMYNADVHQIGSKSHTTKLVSLLRKKNIWHISADIVIDLLNQNIMTSPKGLTKLQLVNLPYMIFDTKLMHNIDVHQFG